MPLTRGFWNSGWLWLCLYDKHYHHQLWLKARARDLTFQVVRKKNPELAGSWPNKYKVLLRTPGLENGSLQSPRPLVTRLESRNHQTALDFSSLPGRRLSTHEYDTTIQRFHRAARERDRSGAPRDAAARARETAGLPETQGCAARPGSMASIQTGRQGRARRGEQAVGERRQKKTYRPGQRRDANATRARICGRDRGVHMGSRPLCARDGHVPAAPGAERAEPPPGQSTRGPPNPRTPQRAWPPPRRGVHMIFWGAAPRGPAGRRGDRTVSWPVAVAGSPRDAAGDRIPFPSSVPGVTRPYRLALRRRARAFRAMDDLLDGDGWMDRNGVVVAFLVPLRSVRTRLVPQVVDAFRRLNGTHRTVEARTHLPAALGRSPGAQRREPAGRVVLVAELGAPGVFERFIRAE